MSSPLLKFFLPEVNGLSESALRILNILAKEKRPLSTHELTNYSHYSPRMVQYSLRKLVGKNLVDKAPDLKDLRKQRYILSQRVRQIRDKARTSVNSLSFGHY
ncbi:MAG: ArsR family transcriptional regulator [Candidatus Hodarchaeales archaeon]